MRIYTDNGKRLVAVRCNQCGQEILACDGIVKEGVFSISYKWGYFSEKDGEIHSFDLCEACYDEWVSSLKIPITVEDNTELL